MQSQYPATDHTPTRDYASPDSSTALQHGRDNNPTPSPPLSSHDDGGGVSLMSTVHASGSTPAQSTLPFHIAARGLSPPKVSSPLSRNRIAEYESATSSPRRQVDGPAFDVIKKPRQPGDKRSPISELPNEVLTHAIAHLSPTDLSSMSLVSRRFHELVTTPHAWRTAFSRYFPGPETIGTTIKHGDDEDLDILRFERRAFSRITALASWRSEYILRTRLLRSLARGKPVQAIATPSLARSGQSHTATPIIMYNSQLFTTINHLHATFGSGLNKRLPRFIHGANDIGTASSSDPAAGKVDSWGLGDPSNFLQFSDRFPGDAQYGLGPGEIVGVPNVMDVSQPHGMVYGEGMPDGMVYFRFVEEMRGRFLAASLGLSIPELGIPKVQSIRESMCSVWIAKTASVPSLSDGSVGIMSGSSLGVVTTYSLGPLGARDQRFGRGEMTARWVLSPGVPIVGLAIDEQYSLKRQAENRIWAVALNALGEVFYLTKFPQRGSSHRQPRLDDEARETAAWLAGRSVYWTVVEPTRRTARPDPYGEAPVDGSYSPRTSWNGMCLSKEQIKAETREIEAFVSKKPKDFQRLCLGWDMRRKLEVDFAGDDGTNAGESVVIIETGIEEDSIPTVKRFTRCRVPEDLALGSISEDTPSLTDTSTNPSAPSSSLFGGPADTDASHSEHGSSYLDGSTQGSITPHLVAEEWRSSTLSFAGLKSVQILATALDCSTFATLTANEDPLLNFSGASSASSPSLTPMSPGNGSSNHGDIPGQRARFLAVGTQLGSVLLWNIRAPVSGPGIVNTIEPLRIIHTDSPQISCLALSALYLVHGGNDGLVQAWDPLASTSVPVRTLNSRFSSRARRRLVQAQASPQGVGINLFAAGAICLDPDPTALRGMVSLGTHLRYWNYSSSAADQYRSHKRRLRRSERGSNSAGERFVAVSRGNIKNFIANEQFELDQEEERQSRETTRMAGRFGTDLLGDDASEEELLAYAALLSQESLAQDRQRQESIKSTIASTLSSCPEHVLHAARPSSRNRESSMKVIPSEDVDENMDPDIAEAIRQSLTSSHSPDTPSWADSSPPPEFPIRFAKPGHKSTPRRISPRPDLAESSNASEATDLEFALQLSLAEEQSRKDALAVEGNNEDGFPNLAPTETKVWVGGNDKGKKRAM